MSTRASSLLAQVPDLPGHEGRRLLLAAAEEEASFLVGDPVIPPQVGESFQRLVSRRRRGEPLQYIEGSVQFGPIELDADSRALIPRPETEQLWELCVAELASVPSPVILDLCTGSGNIALALKHAIPAAVVLATDRSEAAISLARQNADKLRLEVDFLVGDLFAPLRTDYRVRIDLVVANPPYVTDTEYASLPAEIRNHEPQSALVAGEDGLEFLRRIAAEAVDWLRPGGIVACEIGETQGPECLRLFADYQPRIMPDLANRDRFVLGRASPTGDLH